MLARKAGGEFILRIDDTDPERSKQEYIEGVKEDLTWLGITWDRIEQQSARMDRYLDAKLRLIDMGRLYECFETPTGWKFFANLLDAGQVTLCGEESFGTSSDHTREKDGVWAVLAWLNILAATRRSVQHIAQAHWARFGRHYYARHDYEDLPAATAQGLMQALQERLPAQVGQRHGDLQVSQADSFAYQDPVDGSRATDQGLRLVFADAARIIVRLSGTGTQGATLRLYLERYERGERGLETGAALAPLASLADRIVRISEITGRKTPSVVT